MNAPIREERKELAAYFLDQNAAIHPRKREAFLRLYKDLTCVKLVKGIAFPMQIPKFRDHVHVQQLSDLLKQNITTIQQTCLINLFQDDQVPGHGRHFALLILVQLNFMLNCEPSVQYLPRSGVNNRYSTGWQDNESFHDFFLRAIPRAYQPQIFLDDKKHVLKAWKLASRYNIKMVATDDLAEHLLFDPHGRRLKIFHHTSWLLAQLERRTDSNTEEELCEILSLGGLPRALLVETLETFYSVLFPLVNESSRRSRKMLKLLTRESGFDVNSVENGSRVPEPDDFEYYYWGERLSLILEHVQEPAGPSNRLMSWLQRIATDRLALWLVILGLFLSALFGLLSCIIGIAQIWISILAWKNPATA